MVGRDEELAAIVRLLSDAEAGRSGALLIEGEPGIGKTTLLDAARSLAGGFTRLSVQGWSRRPSWPTPGCWSW